MLDVHDGIGPIEKYAVEREILNSGIDRLTRFGFSFERGGSHLARTMMLSELLNLMECVPDPTAPKTAYAHAVVEDNCLGKRSGQTRNISLRHLANLYGIDPSITLFRALRFFWARDPQGQPLIACLCAYARDSILRSSAPFILNLAEGIHFDRAELVLFLDELEPGRFSRSTLKSASQNIASTWTQSGHLKGVVKKTRGRSCATPGACAYALLLGYLVGARGPGLLSTEYARILDCSEQRIIELAEGASQRGWIVFKRVGDVMEVSFPNLLSSQEMEWIREQNQATDPII